jgi:hypothetical protein
MSNKHDCIDELLGYIVMFRNEKKQEAWLKVVSYEDALAIFFD